MGGTYIVVKLRAIEGGAGKEVRLLVDAGSTYSWIPRNELEGLGVRPKGKWSFIIIGGESVMREVGDVMVEWEERVGPTTVVFAQEGEVPVFGAHGLDGLGLEVDYVTREVRRRGSILALHGPKGLDVQSILEREMRRIMDGIPETHFLHDIEGLSVVWSPRSDSGLSGMLVGKEIVIYEPDATKAVLALRLWVLYFIIILILKEYREIAKEMILDFKKIT